MPILLGLFAMLSMAWCLFINYESSPLSQLDQDLHLEKDERSYVENSKDLQI